MVSAPSSTQRSTPCWILRVRRIPERPPPLHHSHLTLIHGSGRRAGILHRWRPVFDCHGRSTSSLSSISPVRSGFFNSVLYVAITSLDFNLPIISLIASTHPTVDRRRFLKQPGSGSEPPISDSIFAVCAGQTVSWPSEQVSAQTLNLRPYPITVTLKL